MTSARFAKGRWRSGIGWLASLLLTGFFCIAIAESAAAKGSPPPPPPPDLDSVLSAFPNGMTGAQLDAVLGVMNDKTLRDGLRKRLVAEMAAREAAASPEGEHILKIYAERLRALPAAYAALPWNLDAAFSRDGTISGFNGAARWIGGIALILAVGAIGMLAVHALLAPVRRRIREQAAGGTRIAIGALVLRLMLDLVEIAAFLAASALTYAIVDPTHPAAPQVLMILLRAIAIVLVISKLTLFFCDPENPGMRLLTVDDTAARALHRIVATTTLLVVGVTSIVRILLALKLDNDSIVALALPLSLLPFAYLIGLSWRNRSAVAERARHWLSVGTGRNMLIDAWPVLLTAYLAILWLVIADGILRVQQGTAPRALASLLLMLSVPLLAWLIHRPLARFYGVTVLTTTGAAPVGDDIPQAAIPPDSSAFKQVQRLM
ncbi:MAG: hypothetical protein ACREFM_19970, partial [Hypericibacter sp.]